MIPKKFVGILLVAAAVSCGRSGKMQRDQKQYDVVQEGSADGVTSTLNAPGETQPLTTSSVTNTNADTTTAFTVPGTATSTSTSGQPGTIAGTFPDSTPPRPRRPRPPATTTSTNP